MIAKGALGVEFDEKICSRLTKSVFAGSFLGVDGRERDSRLVCKVEHKLRRMPNIGLANDQVEITILTHAGFTVTTYGQRRAFGDQHLDAGVCKVCQQA